MDVIRLFGSGKELIEKNSNVLLSYKVKRDTPKMSRAYDGILHSCYYSPRVMMTP